MIKHSLILAAAVPLSLAAAVPIAHAQSGPGLSVSLPDGVSEADFGKRDLQVLAVQVMLDRSRHSPGVMDGYMGGNTRRAIRYYRMANGLPEGDRIDEELLRSLLDTQTGDVFRSYTITQDDVDGPFYDIPSEFPEMAEMERLGYRNAQEMLAERFHMDQSFLAAINPGVDFSKAGQKITIVSHGDEKLDAQIGKIEVRKSDNSVVALGSGGELLASYPATIGSGEFPSPSGSMEVNAIAPEPNYTFDPDDQKWGPDKTFVIPPGPNGPVGGTWIDLGKEGYGIHGSPDPQMVAKRASHGCVRLTNWDAEELAQAVTTGTPVVFT